MLSILALVQPDFGSTEECDRIYFQIILTFIEQNISFYPNCIAESVEYFQHQYRESVLLRNIIPVEIKKSRQQIWIRFNRPFPL